MVEVQESRTIPELEAHHISTWGVTVVGNPERGYSLYNSKFMGRSFPLKGSTLKEATGSAMLAVIGAADHSPDALFRRRETPVREQKPGFVYFIGGEVGAVKIGFAVSPKSRLGDLQCGSPIKLEILATVAGMPRDERDYHKRFAAHRLHREWFERVPEILAEIERLNG